MAKEPKKLDELFHDTLKDIYFAEKKILSALPKMAKAAHDRSLKAAFEKHHAETETHVSRLEQVFGAIDAKPQGKTCHAILGIVEEGEEIALSLLPDRNTMFGVQTHGNQTSWPKAFQACQKQARLDKEKESELSHMGEMSENVAQPEASDAHDPSQATSVEGHRHRSKPHRGRNRTLRDSMSVPQLVFLPRAVIAGNAAIFSPRWTMKAS
jgi:Domain of unknown function (DUF892)